jgi:hypothetical protein
MARRGTNAHIANAATLRNPSAVPQSAQPPSSLPPIIASLRQSVVFAEVTNFLHTFKPAINLDALSATVSSISIRAHSVVGIHGNA